MPRGGARVNSGPPPDPNALRRDRKDDKAGWTTLPSEGRTEEPPNWPLPDLAMGDSDNAVVNAIGLHERELEMWRSLWEKPQAVMWERLRCADEVAIYVRLRVLAERQADVKLLAEARMRGDRLGVDPAGMARLRWRIADDELAARRGTHAGPTAAPRGDMRDRIRAVNGGA